MLKKVLLSLLIFTLVVQEVEAVDQVSDKVIFQVSPTHLEAILKKVQANKILYVHNTKNDVREEAEEDERNLSLETADLTAQAIAHSDSGDEAALVVFAVIGVVMVVAWLPYLPILIHDIWTDDKNLKVHHFLTAQWSLFGGDFNSSDISSRGHGRRSGSLLGLRYSFYEERSEDKEYKMGFATELGHYLVKEKNRLEGSYWLAGPSIVFGDIRPESLIVKLDLMGGTTFDSNIGLISRAEFTVSWLTLNQIIIGISMGGLYMNAEGNSNNLGFVLGVNTGFFF